MIAAYLLIGADCGARFFNDAPPGVLCNGCRVCLQDDYVPRNLAIMKKYDISCTYDNRTIVSRRAVHAFNEYGISDIAFIPVTNREEYYFLKPSRQLVIDEFASGVKHGEQCQSCGLRVGSIFDSLVLRDALFPITDGIFRSDCMFGHNEGKTFAVLVGTHTRSAIIKEGLTGATLFPVMAQQSKPAFRHNA
jgi:hypothetical protein